MRENHERDINEKNSTLGHKEAELNGLREQYEQLNNRIRELETQNNESKSESEMLKMKNVNLKLALEQTVSQTVINI